MMSLTLFLDTYWK